MHHAASHFTVVLTATRDHPVERVQQSAFVAPPLALMGQPHAEFFFASLAPGLVGPLQHRRLDWTLG